MTIGELFLILSGCILSSNYVLVHFFNADTLLSTDSMSLRGSVCLSLYLGLILVVSSLLIWPLENFLLSSLGYLRLLVYVIAILLVTAFVSVITKKKGGELFSLALSSSVLGAVLLYAGNGYTFLETIFASIGTAAGYLVVSVAFSCVREKVRDKYVPLSFRGESVMLLSLGIMALTVYAF